MGIAISSGLFLWSCHHFSLSARDKFDRRKVTREGEGEFYGKEILHRLSLWK